ncbi:MAG: PAS domain S-box protein [Promethearchaeota archaeon]
MSLESLLERQDIPSEVQEVIKKELSEIKRTKARLEYLLKSGPAIIYACEPWGNFQTKFMSENVRDILGFDSEDFLYNPSFWVDRLHPEDRQRATESFSKILDTLFFSEIYRFLQKDGTYRWMLEEANLIRDENGDPLEIVGCWTDITVQKNAEEQLLRERENLYRILNSTDDVIFIINSQHEIEYINAATEKEFGPVEGKRCYNYFNDFLEACSWCTIEDVTNGETIRREKTLTKNKKTYDMIDTPFRNTEGETSSLAILRDITERRKTEEALKESEENFRELVDLLPTTVFEIDPSGNFLFSNRHGLQVSGYTQEDLDQGLNALQLFVLEDRPKVKQNIKRILGGARVEGNEYTALRKDGSRFPVLVYSAPVYRNDKPVKLRGIVVDITQLKETEKALRESEEKYRSFVENFEGIAFKGYKDFSAGFFHGKVEEITGYTEEAFISGKISFNQLIYQEDIQWIKNDVKKFMSSSQKATQREYRIIDKNGNLHWIQESIQKFYDEKLKKKGVYGTLLDITERKLAEEALRESQELFTQFMDHIPASVFIKDQYSVMLFANKFSKDVFGGERWIGKTVMELFPEETANKMITDDQKALNEGLQIIIEDLKDINNVVHTYRTYKFPIKRKDKESLLGGIAIDVTLEQRTKKLLRKERENFYNILNTINDLIYIVNSEFVIEFVNAALEREYDSSAVGKKCYEYFNGFDELCPWCTIKEVLEGNTVRWEKTRTQNQQTYDIIDTPFRNLDGSSSLLSILRDITERKQIEEALKESEQNFRELVNLLPATVFEIDPSGNFLFSNRQGLEISGYTQEDLDQGINALQLFVLEDRPKVKRNIVKILGGEKIVGHEYTALRKDGSKFPVLVYSAPVYRDKKPVKLRGVVVDITLLKETEQALRENEQKFRTFIETLPAPVWIYQNYQCRYVNPAAEQITGHTREELSSMKFWDFLHPDYKNVAIEGGKALEKGLSPSITSTIVKTISDSGNERWLDTRLELIEFEGKQATLIFAMDITERKKVEEALQESEEKYRSFLENFQGIAFRGRIDFTPIFFHGQVEEITGYTEENFVCGTPRWDQIIYQEDLPRIYDSIKGIATIPNYAIEREYRIIHKNGKLHWIQERIQNLCDEFDRPILVQGTISDITERKRAQNALKESEERLRKFMESATDGFTLLDSNLNFIDINKAGLEGLGLSKEEVLGMNILDIFPSLRNTERYEEYLEVIKTGLPYIRDDVIYSDPRIEDKYFSARAFRVGEGLGIISTDITNRMKAETTRKELEQRRDSFVWMTSHELRTPLTVLTGYCDFLLEHLNDLAQKRITNILGVMKNNLDRLERLTSKVSTIGQIERGIFEIEKTSMNLCDFLQDTLEPYHQLLGRDQFEYQGCLDDSPIIIDGDPHRLQQVLDNIIGNAIKQTDKEYRKIRVTPKVSLTEIRIIVTDNGAGIEPKNLEVIFEQFVSIPTEFSATGTGIGLYLCQKTLEAHGGKIIARSEGLGHGATFIIELPR